MSGVNDPQTSRLLRGIRSIIRSQQPNIDFLGAYLCTVQAQAADGTLDITPDDTRLGSFQHVPIKYGVPGITAVVPVGARCELTFAGTDRTRPQVTIWDPGSITSLTVASGTLASARQTDPVSATSAMGTWMSQVAGYINGVAPGTVTPASPLSFGSISGGSAKVRVG